jgi:hypothetical protein
MIACQTTFDDVTDIERDGRLASSSSAVVVSHETSKLAVGMMLDSDSRQNKGMHPSPPA